jgi:tRNA pseudouridine38-40 synthase
LNRLRLDIVYCGTGFNGWQSQADGSGIQDHFRSAIEIVLRIKDPWFVGCSRTDSGVHAEMQVAALDVPGGLPDLVKFRKSLNALLPNGVAVRAVTPVEGDFHPAYAAIAKVYRYRIWNSDWDHPALAPFVWRTTLRSKLDMLASNLDSFVGEHDFSSFCAADSSAKTRHRKIIAVALDGSGPLLDIWIQGQGFLKQMVRNMVGTLVDLDNGRLDASTVPEVLALRDRQRAGRTAPPQGLSLVHVDFHQVTPLDQLIRRARDGFAVAI